MSIAKLGANKRKRQRRFEAFFIFNEFRSGTFRNTFLKNLLDTFSNMFDTCQNGLSIFLNYFKNTFLELDDGVQLSATGKYLNRMELMIIT